MVVVEAVLYFVILKNDKFVIQDGWKFKFRLHIFGKVGGHIAKREGGEWKREGQRE